MGLQCGIVGLPNVGKSTLFNALSNANAGSANYPFCTIDPNVGVVPVPDERLYQIAELVNPEKVIPTTIEFVDIAGLVKGASKGEGLGNKFLANIREVDAIIHLVRCFEDNNVTHVDTTIDPVRDKEVIDFELQLKDLETVEKRILRTEKVAKSGDSKAKGEFDELEKIKKHLEQGKNLREMDLDDRAFGVVRDLQLLTVKPVIYVANVDEASIHSGNRFTDALKRSVASEKTHTGNPSEIIIINASIEAQIAELDDPEERAVYLEEYGLSESGLSKLIKASYHLLDLITFFTAGSKEVRAWTIKNGRQAPQAAGVIHTDFEKGFIKAEVIKVEDFKHFRSEQACREAGRMGIEGKNYVVRDGDIIHFRFNV